LETDMRRTRRLQRRHPVQHEVQIRRRPVSGSSDVRPSHGGDIG